MQRIRRVFLHELARNTVRHARPSVSLHEKSAAQCPTTASLCTAGRTSASGALLRQSIITVTVQQEAQEVLPILLCVGVPGNCALARGAVL